MRAGECEACRRKNGMALGDAVRALEGIPRRRPETTASERAGRLIESWGRGEQVPGRSSPTS